MKYLIDTHVCLWTVSEKHKLSDSVVNILEDPENEILFSQISLFEIAIKVQAGKFGEFTASLHEFSDTLLNKGFSFLPLHNEHLSAYFNAGIFNDNHRDPFDRCLLAITTVENCAIITKDEKFLQYRETVEIVW